MFLVFCERLYVNGCTYVAEHMDVRERRGHESNYECWLARTNRLFLASKHKFVACDLLIKLLFVPYEKMDTEP